MQCVMINNDVSIPFKFQQAIPEGQAIHINSMACLLAH